MVAEKVNTTRVLKWPETEAARASLAAKAAGLLRRGKLVIIPTDTVYGVAAAWNNRRALAALGRLKRRPADRPVAALASDRGQVERLRARFGLKGRALADRFWPGPLTLVLELGKKWEGFRVPAHPAALAVAESAGGLLRVSSANISGGHTPRTAREAVRQIGRGVQLVIDAGPAPGGNPSTVVRINRSKVEILREGAVPRAAIEATCRRALAKTGRMK